MVYVIENHRAKTLIISSIDRLKKIINSQKADLLAIKLVDIFEMEDLKIDLADKKVYQLINKANNMKYYYE